MRVWQLVEDGAGAGDHRVVLFMVLAVGGGLLLWGSNFASNMVHSQLSEQKIAFPPKGAGARPEGVPRTAEVRGPDRRQRPEGKGLRRPVHQGAPEGRGRRQDLLRSERAVAGEPERPRSSRARCKRCSTVRRCVACCSTCGVGRRSGQSPTGPASRHCSAPSPCLPLSCSASSCTSASASTPRRTSPPTPRRTPRFACPLSV